MLPSKILNIILLSNRNTSVETYLLIFPLQYTSPLYIKFIKSMSNFHKTVDAPFALFTVQYECRVTICKFIARQIVRKRKRPSKKKRHLPLVAFHGRHSNELDLNHTAFHQYQIILLQVEQLQKVNFCWFHGHRKEK